jgi:hypothetical protein
MFRGIPRIRWNPDCIVGPRPSTANLLSRTMLVGAIASSGSGHHARDCPARLGLVKGLRLHYLAPTALRAAYALDEALGRARSWALT